MQNLRRDCAALDAGIQNFAHPEERLSLGIVQKRRPKAMHRLAARAAKHAGHDVAVYPHAKGATFFQNGERIAHRALGRLRNLIERILLGLTARRAQYLLHALHHLAPVDKLEIEPQAA